MVNIATTALVLCLDGKMMSCFNIHTFIYIIIMWPAEQKPAHPAKIEFQFYPYRSFSSYTEIIAPGSVHCTVLCYEPRLCYYKGTISLDSQAGQWKRVAMESLVYTFFKKGNFTSLQSVYGCLSVYMHTVSPHFHNRCLSQLSC